MTVTDRQQDSYVSSTFPFEGRGSYAATWRLSSRHRRRGNRGSFLHGLSPDIVIFVPTEAGCAVEVMTVRPRDLQAVHEGDVAMLSVYSVWEGRRSLRPD